MQKEQLNKKFVSATYLTFKIVIVIIVVFFLIFNLIYSQKVPSLYFQLAKDDKKAVVNFLNKIQTLPAFSAFLAMNKNIYGSSLELDVFASDNKRQQVINEYELLLEKNPKSRDLLYSLYILYLQDGNNIIAQEYLKKAKEIDPSINN